MAFDLEEQEKIDRLKAFWEQWGNVISGAVLLFMLSILAWQGWHWYQSQQARKAVAYYEVVASHYDEVDSANLQRLQEANQVLQDKYGSSLYAGRAALLTAYALSAHQDYASAATQLEALIERSSRHPELEGTATLQLATILANQGQFEAAFEHLSQPVEGYEALYADRRGDIAWAQGDAQQAGQYWHEAMTLAANNVSLQQSIEYKLTVLGVENE